MYNINFIANIRNQWMPVSTNNIACFANEMLNYIYLFCGEQYIIDFVTPDETEELMCANNFIALTGSIPSTSKQ